MMDKFKDQDALQKAYKSLEKEFTRRSQRLRELQGKIEQGTLIELPCCMGSKMYVIYEYEIEGEKVVEKITVDGFMLVFDRRGILVQDNALRDWYEYGKEAFLTREEAEKRLKEITETK